MGYDEFESQGKTRIVQELVPGKQVTIAHIIANPDESLYAKLGMKQDLNPAQAVIGILTVSPAETAVIAADLAIKAAGIMLTSIDRYNGTLMVTGSFSEVEASVKRILDYLEEQMGFDICGITRT